MFFKKCDLVPETSTCHACHGSFYTFQYVRISINNFNFIQQNLPFRNGAVKTITYARMYIAKEVTVTTMHVIETAGYKKFPEGHRKKLFRFLCFTTQSSLKPILTAELNFSGQSKAFFIEQKFECKEEDKNIEVKEV